MIFSDDRPAIGQQAGFGAARVDHGFDGKGHTGHQFHAGSGGAIVQDLRFLVKPPPDSMATILSNYGKNPVPRHAAVLLRRYHRGKRPVVLGRYRVQDTPWR